MPENSYETLEQFGITTRKTIPQCGLGFEKLTLP